MTKAAYNDIQLVVLKTGEQIIARIKEIPSGNKVVGLLLNQPFRIVVDDQEESVRLLPWMILSKNTEVPCVADHIVCVIEPIDDLVSHYMKYYVEQITEENENGEPETTSTDEQADSTDTD